MLCSFITFSSSSLTWTSTSNTSIWASKIVTLLMIKLLLIAQMLSKHAKLESNVPLLPLTKLVLKSSIWSKCGNHLTVPSETLWEELFSVNQSSSKTSQDVFQDGLPQLLSVDTPLETNTAQLTLFPRRQVHLLWLLPQLTEVMRQRWLFTSLRAPVLCSACTTLMNLFMNLLTAALSLRSKDNILCIFRQRTQFSKSMMDASKIFSKKCINPLTKRSLMLWRFGTSTVSSTI